MCLTSWVGRKHANYFWCKNNYESLNCAVEVTTEVEVTDAYEGDNGNFTLTLKGCSFGVYVSFLFKPYPETQPNFVWNNEEQWIGAKLLVKGVYTYLGHHVQKAILGYFYPFLLSVHIV